MSERAFVRVQEKGQVTLPARLRSKLGIRKGDLVAVEETPAGLLISPQRAIPTAVLERLGKTLAEQGISFADLEAWADAGQTPDGIPVHDYTASELQQILADDILSAEEEAIVRRFERDDTTP